MVKFVLFFVLVFFWHLLFLSTFLVNLVKDFILFKQCVEDVFVEVEPILRSALDGNNVCMLAFGQTGTGKTYTMVCLSCFVFDIISAGFVV